jgi:hypothetical protein
LRRKLIQKVLLTLFILLIVALPAAAEEVNITLNGQAATFVDAYMENGVTMIDVHSFAKLSGAKVDTTTDSIGIFKNNVNLFLAVDKREAQLGGKAVQLPFAPIKSGENVYVPLRYLCDLFGYNLSWDNANAAVNIEVIETKNGMSPLEVLNKANEATQEINTYSMDGSFIIDMDMSADGQQQISMNGLTTTMSGQIQNQPMEVYLIQTMELPILLGQEDSQMIMETYMTEEKMYFKSSDQPWTVQDMVIPPEFWQEQQNIQSNPLEAAAQMKEMGIILTFSDDVVVDDKEYYVVNALLDMDSFREAGLQIMEQVMGSMPNQDIDLAKLEEIIDQILSEGKIDYYYTSLINKETFISDILLLDMKFDLPISLPEIADSFTDDDTTALPQTMHIKMKMTGEFRIKDIGKPFEAPNVKDAIPFPTI